MRGRLQGSARPDFDSTHVPEDTPVQSGDLGDSGVGGCADRVSDRADASVFDRVLFRDAAPFVAITAANEGVVTTRSRRSALEWLAEETAAREDVEVATVAGTLRECVLAADVDPADTGAPEEAGQAAAEELIELAEDLGLPWLLRASGREGGRHVLVTGELDHDDWRRWCHRAAVYHDVGVQPRRTLRLLAAPHRSGLPAPVLGGTLVPSDLSEPTSSDGPRRRSTVRSPRRSCAARSSNKVSSTPLAGDRSRREYGAALARGRAGWSAGRTYAAVAVPGSKAAEQGELNWRRWVWSRAVTVVAAERGVTEDEAWTEFERASRRRARELGREAWRRTYWWPALEDAEQERPRRRRLESAGDGAPSGETEQAAEVERVRAGLHAAVADVLEQDPRRPQFRRSVAAALDALAPVLVRRAGSIAERAWCEAAQLARSTLRALLPWLVEHGILARDRRYNGGTADCASWALGPRSQVAVPTSETRSTGGTPPPQPPTVGRADSTRLRRVHERERQTREADLSLLTDASVSSEADPAAHRMARSLTWQQRWWHSLDEEEQQIRRAVRRRMLDTIHRSRRSAWLSWLSQRNDLAAAAERVLRGRAETDDHRTLAAAPTTVHRGLHAPPWKDETHTALADVSELDLAA